MEDDAELTLSQEDEDSQVAGLPEARARHAMEIDADRPAIWTMLQLQARGDEPFELLGEKPSSVRLTLSMIAALLTVFLFEKSSRRREAASSGQHPLPLDRMRKTYRYRGRYPGRDKPGGILRCFRNARTCQTHAAVGGVLGTDRTSSPRRSSRAKSGSPTRSSGIN